MHKKFSSFATLLVVALLFGSCTKFVEGGKVSQAETNIQRSWVLIKYLRNNVDETAQLLIKNYEETYASTKVYNRNYIDKDNKTINENGSWKFERDEKRVNVNGVSSIKLTNITGTVSSSHHNILRLTGSELWYYYINGGDRHEFRFVKK